MTYRQLILGDANVGRFWQAAHGRLSSLRSATFTSVTCPDTLQAGLGQVTDEFDFVIVSASTSLMLDEGAASASDLRGTTRNILDMMTKQVSAAAMKSKRCEVCMIYEFRV